jgi:hypothetical protein
MQRTTSDAVSRLHPSALDVTPRHFDFSKGFGSVWDYRGAVRCSDCDAAMLVSGGEEEHREVDPKSACDGYVGSDCPMMNFLYALPVLPDDEAIVAALADLPLCVITLPNAIEGEDTFLALTGGGMDTSWYIVEAYVRLGYLPPVYFSLPSFAGTSLTPQREMIIEACKESQRVAARSAKHALARLHELEQDLRARKAA